MPAVPSDPIVSRVWSVYSTGAGGNLNLTNNTSPTFSYKPVAGGLDVVTLTVTSQSGVSATTSVIVPVSQTPIALSLSGTLKEGTPGTLSATVTNPVNGVTYTFNWTVRGEAFPFVTSGAGANFTFTPPTAGPYLASVTAAGSDGTSGSASQVFQAALVPPSASLILPTGTVYEGTPVTLGANVTNPGGSADPLTYQWGVTGPDGFSATGAAPTLPLTPFESGSYSVTLTVTDATGASASAVGSFTITHVQPVPTITNTGLTVNGSSFQANLSATVPDPGSDDAFTYTWSVTQNGSAFGSPQSGSSANFTLNGTLVNSYVVTLTVTDDDGGSGTSSTAVVVAMTNTTCCPVPAAPRQVLAVAGPNVTIDASHLPASVAVVEVAIGGHDTLIGGRGPSVLIGALGQQFAPGRHRPRHADRRRPATR